MDVTRAVTSAVQLSATVSTVPLKATAHIARGALTVSEVKPRIGVQFVDPKTATSYVVPAADLSYILMDVEAYVDVRGLCPIVRDLTPVIDLKSFLVGKGVADQATTQETTNFELGRALSNTVYTGEILDILLEILRYPEDYYSVSDASTIGINPNKTEVVVTSELYSLLYEKGLQDVAGIAEQKKITFSKPVAESQSVADQSSRGYAKAQNDVVIKSDVFNRVVNFVRTPADSVGSSEQRYFALGKSAVDAVAASDLNLRDLHKAVADAFTAPDVAAIEAQYNRFFDESAAAGDESALSYGKNTDDGVSVADSFDRVLDIGLQLADVQTAVDFFEKVIPISKYFADVVRVTADHGPVNEIVLNTILMGGVLGGDFAKPGLQSYSGASDSFGVSDGGSWLIQDYGQGDYFAQDYVGIGGSI